MELSALGDLLRNQKVFGFDVEYQHYKKIICSIQIATFTSDFLIDTMCFNRTKIENTLKAAFEDPTILKVIYCLLIMVYLNLKKLINKKLITKFYARIRVVLH